VSAKPFRFISWTDVYATSGDGLSILAAVSKQAAPHAPAFTIYTGDLEKDGFSTTEMDAWKAAVGGNVSNGMFDIVFPARGNYDEKDAAGWQAYFDTAATAAKVGATNFSALDEDLNYSFDYENAHFVVMDVPGDNTLMTSAQLAWLDADLTAAEKRGLMHAFLFWHGPIYSVGPQCCPLNEGITDVINKHPIVSATFHGHEHLFAYVHVDATRIATTTRAFEQFVGGATGAELFSCNPARSEWCMADHGYSVVDVEGGSFAVIWYRLGDPSPQAWFQFTKP
jgi:hypothetical protein